VRDPGDGRRRWAPCDVGVARVLDQRGSGMAATGRPAADRAHGDTGGGAAVAGTEGRIGW
jgi:hypothetical protein